MNISEFRQQYPQYEDVSDQDLAKSLHKKYYNDVSYDEFANKFGVSKQDKMSSPMAAISAFNARAGDLPHGLLQPILESGFLGDRVKQASKDFAAQRESDYQQAVEADPTRAKIAGLLGSIGSTIPVAANPGTFASTLPRLIGAGVAQGAATGFGQYVPEGGSRLLNTGIGAVLAGAIPAGFAGVGKALSLVKKPVDYVAKNVLSGVDEKAALAAKEAGERLGVNLTPAEASGSPLAGAAQGRLGVTDEGALKLQSFSEQRKGQEKAAIQNLLNEISPNAAPAANKVRDVAQTVISKEEKVLRDTAKPFYEAAYAQEIPQDKLAGLLDDGIIARSFARVTKDPIYSNEIKNSPANSIKVLDYVKRDIDDAIGAAKRTGANNEARMMLDSKSKLLNVLDSVSEDYKAARNIYSEGAAPLNQLKESNLGKISELNDRQLKNVSKTIFDPSQTDIKVMRNLRDKISKQSPDAWNRIVRNEMERRLDNTQATGSSFYNGVLKSDRNFNQFMIAVEKIPGAQQKLSDMREAFKNIINPVTPRTASRLAKSSLDVPRTAPEYIKKAAEKLAGGKFDKAAIDIITSGKWDKELARIRSTKSSATKAQMYANLLSKASTVGAANTANEIFKKENQ